MAKPYQSPTGRITSKSRPFEEVVRDLRHAVFSVVRHRDIGNGKLEVGSLGSGFFISPEVFLTCYHVIASSKAPHQDGDSYHLVCNLTGMSGAIHVIKEAKVGESVHLFQNFDLALLISKSNRDQPYVALQRPGFPVGKEIGVAGYPLARLNVVDGQLRYDGLIFRVAKGVVTATYKTQIATDQGYALPDVDVVEVNFLFVPGNSGGPVFDAETGRVSAFVHGYTTTKIREKVEEANLVENLPDGMSRNYIENLNALYSLAINLDCAWGPLPDFGI